MLRYGAELLRYVALRNAKLRYATELPHYNENRDTVLDGRLLYAEISLPDSHIVPMLAIPDGSYVLSEGGHEVLHGEGHLLCGGKMTQISGPGDQIALTKSFFMDYLVENRL